MRNVAHFLKYPLDGSGHILGHYLVVGVVDHWCFPLALVVGVVNHRPLPFSTAWGGLAGGVRDLGRLPLAIHILVPVGRNSEKA